MGISELPLRTILRDPRRRRFTRLLAILRVHAPGNAPAAGQVPSNAIELHFQSPKKIWQDPAGDLPRSTRSGDLTIVPDLTPAAFHRS